MSENENLEQARRERQLTLQQAADKVGVHLSTFYGWRTGKHKPHLSSLQMLCQAFDATPEELGYAELVRPTSSQQEEPEPAKQQLAWPSPPLFAEEEGETSFNEPTVLYDTFEVEVLAEGLHWSARVGTDELLQQSVLGRLRRVDVMTEQNSESAHMSRRQALRAIAKAPISLYGLTVVGATRPVAAEEVLPLCAAGLIACRELINEGDIASVKSILSVYLPALVSFVQQPMHSQRAARLAAQGYLLATSVASHVGRLDKMEQFCKQACRYAQQAQDVNLEVVALIRLAVTYDYAHRPRKALETYQVALQYMEQLSPLLGSLLYARLAGKLANCAERQDALRYLALARETFPVHPEEDPYAFLPGMGRSQLLSWDGLTHKHLGQYEEAWQTFAQVGTLQPRTELSERTRVEFLTYAAEAAVGLRDMERCMLYLETAGKGSLQLGHEQRYAEACEVYRLARTVWPQEAKVVQLQDLFTKR
jgi:transcriptional regulator with XRE-family HTH domain